MNQHELNICAGQRLRIVCNISAPDGTDVTLRGGVTYIDDENAKRQLEMQTAGHELLCGLLPVGRWVYEVRAGGRTLLYGAIKVHPSPLEPVEGVAVWQMDATLDAAEVAVKLTELPGADGKSAYQIACDHGFLGSEEEWLETQKGATPEQVAAYYAAHPVRVMQQHMTTTAAGGNASFTAARFRCPGVGSAVSIKQMAMVCRTAGSICPEPLYLVVSVQSGDGWAPVAVSQNACVQTAGQQAVWLFDNLCVAGGEMLDVQASYSPQGDVTDNAWLGCMGVAAADAQCQGTNGSWVNMVPVLTMDAEVDATPVMLTEQQRARLFELLEG